MRTGFDNDKYIELQAEHIHWDNAGLNYPYASSMKEGGEENAQE